tara:strand:- start:129 stop:770 length:642 start_codon:yes stop_codon:yes gene_type:complete
MKRSEIRDRILLSLNDSASSPVFWSTAQVDAVVDESREILAEEAGSIKRSAFAALRPGTVFYYTQGIAENMMAPYRVTLPEMDRRLKVASLSEMDAHNQLWQRVTGDPWWWIPISWNLFAVYPHTATGGGVMKVDYLAWPEAFVHDDEESESPEADDDAMILYGVYDGLLKQWNVARGLEIFSQFIERWIDSKARSEFRRLAARESQRGRVDV